jgi:phage gp16-like protein
MNKKQERKRNRNYVILTNKISCQDCGCSGMCYHNCHRCNCEDDCDCVKNSCPCELNGDDY